MAEHYGAANIVRPIGVFYGRGHIDCMETHGERIRRLRLQSGMTQVELADQAKVDQSTLSAIESKNAMPSGETLLRLSDALGAPADYLLRGKSKGWPFSVDIGRWVALGETDRAYVAAKLEAAIEAKEEMRHAVTPEAPRPQTGPAESDIKKVPVEKYRSRTASNLFDVQTGTGNAVGGPGGIPKPRRKGRPG